MSYAYRRDVLDALAAHGVTPAPETRPALVHEFVSDLYRYELRRLRDRLRRGEFPKREYFDRVVELRRRYAIISMRPADWIET
jgi:hypothetical protein